MRNFAPESSGGSVIPHDPLYIDGSRDLIGLGVPEPSGQTAPLSGKNPRRKRAVFPFISKAHSTASDRSGFTLLEILVSLVVLSVGIMGVTALSSTAINATVQARAIDNCYNLSFDLLDRLHSNQEDINSLGSSFVIDPNSCDGSGSDIDEVCRAMRDMKFNEGLIRVDIVNDTPIPGLVTATVSVSYSSKGGNKECQVVDIIPHS